MNRQGTTAILVFANSAKEDLANKHIPQGEQLFDVLTQTTLKKAKNTGLPVFHFSDKDQVGATFGERFTNAISNVFDRGFSNIITIGNDTPHLKTEHLKHTAQQLAMGKTVIGPSNDGGFYLLGIQKSNFDVAVFKNLPWQRFSLYHEISLWLHEESAKLIKLPILQDLDNEKDLQSLLSFSRSLSSTLLLLIIGLLKIKRSLYYTHQDFIRLFLDRFMYNKGSPEVSFI